MAEKVSKGVVGRGTGFTRTGWEFCVFEVSALAKAELIVRRYNHAHLYPSLAEGSFILAFFHDL